METTETTQSNELVKIIETSGLEQTKAQVLLEKFTNFFELAAEWELKAKALVITDVNQKAEMRMAAEGRKFLKAKRVEVENTRKKLKEDSLREGQTIDSIAKILKNLIEPIENDLEQKEKFVEIKAAEEKAKRTSERLVKVSPYVAGITESMVSDMSDETFEAYLIGVKKAHEDKIEAERKAEEERIAREKAEAEEKERIRLENERLKKEAEERENILAEERAKAEAERKAAEEKARIEREKVEAENRRIREEQEIKLKKEREERERVEAELKAKKEAEIRAKREADDRAEAEIKAKILAEKKAKSAPDKEKLKVLALQIESLDLPELATEEGVKILKDVKIVLDKISNHIRTKTDNL